MISFYPYPLETKKDISNRTRKIFKDYLRNRIPGRTLSYAQWLRIFEYQNWSENWFTREKHIRRYGFVIQTTEVISRLSFFLRGLNVLDVGAGAGYLSECLRHRGTRITAIDNFSHSYCGGDSFRKVSRGVIECDVRDHDVAKYQAVILSWPHDGMETLSKMVAGQYLIYQGESWGGCTGSDEFHECLNDEEQFVGVDADFLNEYALQFSGIHDRWYIYRKM